MIKIADINFDDILIVENPYENILVYNISYKTLIIVKPLRFRFNKIYGFIRYVISHAKIKLDLFDSLPRENNDFS